MRFSSSRDRPDRPILWASYASAPLLALLLLGMTSTVGCSGCSDGVGTQASDDENESDEDEEKRKKPDYEIKPVVPLLSESIVSTDDDETNPLVKAGHWTSTVQPMRANYNDLDARNTIELLKSGKPNPLAFTPFHLASSRPAVLAKGRIKRVTGEVFVPEYAPRRFDVTSRLIVRGSGAVYQPGSEGYESGPPWMAMPSYQYFLLVLAAEPDAYGFLKLTDAVRSPWEGVAIGGANATHYRVVLADANKAMPVPTSALNLTSVAYMIWDQVDIDRLDGDQQNAIVDWMHWGGRLIVNGPDSLANLRGSFLDPYLPAEMGESIQIDAAQLTELNATWTQRTGGKDLSPVKPTRPWSGVNLAPRDEQRDHQTPGTSGLLVERSVGSGSVVVSAFRLTERDFVNWEGFDGFLNGALLRRMPRTFFKGEYGGLSSDWANLDRSETDTPVIPNRRLDAHFTTPLRWFARDAETAANYVMPKADAYGSGTIAWQPNSDPDIENTSSQPMVDRAGGLGSWSEFNPVADIARNALTVAAGVRVPAASFVVGCLAVYLFVLVPLNWMVFRALGRIEWAWIAAPVIAIAGTVAVVQQAQLDIGFVRSQTEIALLELQEGYDRGYLTRFTALYSSLSTTYELEFDDPSAVATPFPADDQFKLAIGDPIDTVTFEKYEATRLRGLPVVSASTRFVHSEQMYALDGGVRVTFSTNGLKQLENTTGLKLADAMLVHRGFDRNSKPAYSAAWVGQMNSGGAVLMPVLKPLLLNNDETPFPTQRQQAAAVDGQKRLDVNDLLRLAMKFPDAGDPFMGQREETRLIARIDGVLPGAVASPAASQTAGATVVLAHVAYPGPLPTPRPDVLSVADVFPKGRPVGDEGALLEKWISDEP